MSEQPLFWVGLTVSVYTLSLCVYKRYGKAWFLHPVLLSIALLTGMLELMHVEYASYRQMTSGMSQFLGLAIVALGVPLYQLLKSEKEQVWRWSAGMLLIAPGIMMVGVLLFAVVAGVLGIAVHMDAVFALLTRSSSAPIALSVAEVLHANPNTVVSCVLFTGIPGMLLSPMLLKWLKIRDERTQGMILGITSHAFGVGRALEVSPRCAASATLGMVMMGVATVLATPLIWHLVSVVMKG